MRRSNAPTLQDVAREAGVSAMTVSVVLNGARSATRVSDATRARIEEVAARLRYRPNAAARAVKRRRMDAIGVVSVVDGGVVNLYVLEVLSGILEAASAHSQNTTVLSVANWSQDERRILQFCDGRVDGIILVGPLIRPAFAETLHQQAPFVSIHANSSLPSAWNLDVDNEGGAYAMVRHLISLGHRHILHLAGPLYLAGPRQRLAGYRRALEEAGIAYDDSLVVEAGFDSYVGNAAMNALLDAREEWQSLPTAVFCVNDAVAVGCLEALTLRGIRVPEDVSVAGFDDALNARMTSPQLTTVRQPFRQLGRRAVEMLLTQIRLESGLPLPETDAERPMSPAYPHTEILNVELVVRGSVGPPVGSPLTTIPAGPSPKS